MTKEYYAAIFPKQGHWEIPIDTDTKKVLAWKGKIIPEEIAKDWRAEWGVVQLTKKQWTSLLFIEFDVSKLKRDMDKVNSTWSKMNVIRKGKAWIKQSGLWALEIDPSQKVNYKTSKKKVI